MGAEDLSKRANWQTESGKEASIKEKSLIDVFKEEFFGTEFVIHNKPKDFKKIYSSIALSKEMLASIYNPPKIGNWGMKPDFSIANTRTRKTLYGENKNQEGWIEDGNQNDGRGNVHERVCKLFTPGLLETLREQGKLGDNVLPFWAVFTGNITRDPKRVREIYHWFKGYEDHVFLWQNSSDGKLLVAHFNDKLKRLFI